MNHFQSYPVAKIGIRRTAILTSKALGAVRFFYLKEEVGKKQVHRFHRFHGVVTLCLSQLRKDLSSHFKEDLSSALLLPRFFNP